jgi:peptidoglycan-N-acetylmuramic acid deacetylase
MKILVSCAAVLLLLTLGACEISRSAEPFAVIKGTPGISDEKAYTAAPYRTDPITPPADAEPAETPAESQAEPEREEPARKEPDAEGPAGDPDPGEDPLITDEDIPAGQDSDENQTDEDEPPENGHVSTDKTLDLPDDVVDPYPSEFQASSGGLSNEKLSWYYNRNKEHQPPTAQRTFDIREYGGYYLGDISRKVVYLTFDEGYENGCTPAILDTLRDKGVPAAFFMTQTFIRDNPELAVRIASEGHVAANHSVRHKSSPDLSDAELESEILDTKLYFEETCGYPMAPFFRPPMGEYSERTLSVTWDLGIYSIFWSFAHQDWLVDDQPSVQTTFDRVMDNLHNGMIILLHAVSTSNTAALPDIIDAIRNQGYEFRSLNDLKFL